MNVRMVPFRPLLLLLLAGVVGALVAAPPPPGPAIVNSGTGSSLREGRILFQSEGAEIYYRGLELHPLDGAGRGWTTETSGGPPDALVRGEAVGR